MLVEVGIVFEVEANTPDEAEDVVKDIVSSGVTQAREEEPLPIKIWAASNPQNDIRLAEFHLDHVRCMHDPDFGWTPEGKEYQEKMLQEAAEDVAQQAEFDTTADVNASQN
jgi:hypothetical protein